MVGLDINYLADEEPWSEGTGKYNIHKIPDRAFIDNLNDYSGRFNARYAGAGWSLQHGNAVIDNPDCEYSGDLNIVFEKQKGFTVSDAIAKIEAFTKRYKLFNNDHEICLHKWADKGTQSFWVHLVFIHKSRHSDFSWQNKALRWIG